MALRVTSTHHHQIQQMAHVAAAVMHAMFNADPKRRYLVVPVDREAEITIRKAIEELVQLNEGDVYSYECDDLVEMLDEALTN